MNRELYKSIDFTPENKMAAKSYSQTLRQEALRNGWKGVSTRIVGNQIRIEGFRPGSTFNPQEAMEIQ